MAQIPNVQYEEGPKSPISDFSPFSVLYGILAMEVIVLFVHMFASLAYWA